MNANKSFWFLLSFFFLIGCGDNSNSYTQSTDFDSDDVVIFYGEVEARQLSNRGLDFHAAFLSMNTPFQFDLLNNEYLELSDTCSVADIADRYIEDPYSLRAEFGLPEKFGGYVTVSAGEAIEFKKPDGSPFWTLYEYANSDFTRYSHDQDPFDDQQFGGADDIPDNITVNIPGNVFPEFLNVSVPQLLPLSMFSPTSGTPISSNTEFMWNASNLKGSSILIYASNDVKTVECRIVDDGYFKFSDETQLNLESDFFSSYLLVARSLAQLHRRANASLLVRRTTNYSLY